MSALEVDSLQCLFYTNELTATLSSETLISQTLLFKWLVQSVQPYNLGSF